MIGWEKQKLLLDIPFCIRTPDILKGCKRSGVVKKAVIGAAAATVIATLYPIKMMRQKQAAEQSKKKAESIKEIEQEFFNKEN